MLILNFVLLNLKQGLRSKNVIKVKKLCIYNFKKIFRIIKKHFYSHYFSNDKILNAQGKHNNLFFKANNMMVFN